MKMMNVYYGQDPYDFERNVNHYTALIKALEEDVDHQRHRAHEAFEQGKVCWYLITVVDINPRTGETIFEKYFECKEEKEKVILNARAKKPYEPKAHKQAIDVFIADMLT